MTHTHSRGFIGLISLLIVSALMAFFYWRTDVFSGKNSPSVMQQNFNAIQAAKDVKKVMDQRAADEIEMLAN